MFRVILHLDMDAFFASIEQRDHPEWRKKPVIVGAPPTQRGVVCTASYEARKFGIRSGIASVIAGRLCREGVFVTPRMDVYRQDSMAIMNILASAGGQLEAVSIDEAYIDLSGHCQAEDADASLQRAVPIAQELKERIRAERNLTSTVGIGGNKLLAKIASDLKKPDGLMVITESGKVAVLRPLSVRNLYGVGEVTEQVLNGAGIRSIGDLQDYAGDLQQLVGSQAARLKNFALGIDDRPLETRTDPKSISSEETFLTDTHDLKVLMECLWNHAAEIEAQLREWKKEAHAVEIKVRYENFDTLTRQTTFKEPVSEAKDIYAAAYLLLRRHKMLNADLRLLGIEVHKLRDCGARQISLL